MTEPELIKGKRYKYTTSAIHNGHFMARKWFVMTVIHHEPELHLVWIKMKGSGIHRVIETSGFIFKEVE